MPVLSVTTLNKADTLNQYIPFSNFDIDTKTEHGNFDLGTGIFTVKTAGIYQFQLSGHVQSTIESIWHNPTHHLEIRVNGKTRAISHVSETAYSGGVIKPVDLSAFMQLNSGDKVGVFLLKGRLHIDLSMHDFGTKFSCILFPI